MKNLFVTLGVSARASLSLGRTRILYPLSGHSPWSVLVRVVTSWSGCLCPGDLSILSSY